MDLRARLDAELKAAMKSGDDVVRRTIRSVKSAITYAETAGDQHITLDDEGILAVIRKEVKQRRESVEEFRKGKRDDLVNAELQEIAVLEKYLPRQLSRDEIRAEVQTLVAELGAHDQSQLGNVMKAGMARLRGRADGRVVQEVVRELLGAG